MASETIARSAEDTGESSRTVVGYKPVPIPKDNAQESLPRVATARVPLLNTVPSEIDMYRRHNVTTSQQDEAKLLMAQKCQHNRIIDIGAQIHRLTLHTAAQQQEAAVAEAENRVWEHAEAIRIKALQDLQAKLVAHHDEAMKRLKKEHDKILKEEAVRVETKLRQMTLDQVRQEREEGEKRLKAAVQEVEERCRKEREEAVRKARNEEQEKSEMKLKELDRSWQAKYDDMVKKLNEEKQRELRDLTDRKDWERQAAILQTIQAERETALAELNRVSENYESRIQVLNHKIQEKMNEIRNIRDEKVKAELRMKRVGRELFETRDMFKEYIHLVCQSMPGQADYQMPVTDIDRNEFL